MQKLTVTFIYGKDDTRKLKYRLTGDIPIGVMLEKLIGFQFIVDSADPKTFNVMHKGVQIEDLSKTFEECEIIDGDEIYLVPTVFDPIPPLPENDAPIKKAPSRNHERDSFAEEESASSSHSHNRSGQNRQGGRNTSHGNGNYRRGSQNNNHSNSPKKQGDFNRPERKSEKPQGAKPQTQSTPQGEKKDAPIPFKPHSRNFHRNHGRRSGNSTNKQS